VEDDLGLKVPGIHCIQCECYKVNVGQMSCGTETRGKKHAQYIYLFQPDRLMVAEHKAEAGHHINFKDTTLLARMADYKDRLVKRTMRCSFSLITNTNFLLSRWKMKSMHSFSTLVFHSFHY
jgi:hypothetical protein